MSPHRDSNTSANQTQQPKKVKVYVCGPLGIFHYTNLIINSPLKLSHTHSLTGLLQKQQQQHKITTKTLFTALQLEL